MATLDAAPPPDDAALEATEMKLEEMSKELDALLAALEADAPAELVQEFHASEKEREEEDAAALSRDPPARLVDMKARMEAVTRGCEAELRELEGIEELQRKIDAEEKVREDDCEAAARELAELRALFDLTTGAGESDTARELQKLVDRKHGHEESKTEDAPAADAADSRDLAARADEAAARGSTAPPDAARHPEDAVLEAEAAPSTEEEGEAMALILKQMQYKALGVENDQLRKQIEELEALKRSLPGEEADAPPPPPAEGG